MKCGEDRLVPCWAGPGVWNLCRMGVEPGNYVESCEAEVVAYTCMSHCLMVS